MKFLYYTIIVATYLSVLPRIVFGQNLPNGSTRPAATAITTPAAYNAAGMNSVRIYSAQMITQDTSVIISNSNISQRVRQIATYYDGLGRPLQEVEQGISPAGYDLVTPKIYDNYGRVSFNYLPYVHSGSNDGSFKQDPFNYQKSFLSNPSLNPGLTGESIFYSRTIFEAGPLNRVLKVFSEGNSWAMEGGNHPIEKQYGGNAVVDSVKIWNFQMNGNAPVNSGNYGTGQLTRVLEIDEQGNKTISYLDKRNLLILKKQLLNGTSTGHSGWLCTYYVYDDQKNLRCIIPPKAVSAIQASWVIPIGVYEELCYRYTYDNRNRMITSKAPGAAIIEMAYDVRDRLVYKRDGNMRRSDQNLWLVTYYDDINRQIETALLKDTSSLATLQNQLTSTKALNPVWSASVLTPITYNYYDNYTYSGVKAAVTTEFSKLRAGNNPYSQPITAVSQLTKGLLTGSKALVLGTTQWISKSFYYDDKGRLIQTVSDNLQSGQEIKSSLYDFSGKELSTYTHITNPRSAKTPDIKIAETKNYDGAGRILSIADTLNDDPTTGRIIVQNSYDELGRLKSSSYGTINEPLQYEYNIKGWLTSINKNYLDPSKGAAGHFGEELSYDYGYSTNQFNGNVAGIKWRGATDGIPREYGYIYDAADRIITANFGQQNTIGAAWTKNTVDYTANGIGYDPNGNLISMTQRGLKGSTVSIIDSLKYTYLDNSNKLLIVKDLANDPSSVLGDFKETSQNVADNNLSKPDYIYDVNGNITVDNNTGITYLSYNYLNVPDRIQINGKGRITYVFDAAGNKLRKIVTDSSQNPVKILTTDYINGMEFLNDTLQFIGHPGGRIRARYYPNQPVKYVYDYFIKDHLNSIREVLTEESDTATYIATMEVPNSTTENALFSNIDASRVPAPAGYQSDNLTNPDNSVAALNAENGKKIGPSLVLRVMAGDTVQIGVSAFYKSGGTIKSRYNFGAQMVSALIQALNSPGEQQGLHWQQSEVISAGSVLDSNFYNNLVENSPEWESKPKAYLSYLLFDDQMNLQKNVSGVKQVPSNPDQPLQLGSGPVVPEKSGFAYIYVSNESAQDVDFNNLTVIHKTGPLLEETHYYPFGLTMAGISSNVLKGTAYPKNKLEFNGIEHTMDLDLNQYDAKFRTFDPKIGRWWQPDPKPTVSESPYAAMQNNPVRYSDILGDTVIFGKSTTQQFRDAFNLAIAYLREHGQADLYDQLQSSTKTYVVSEFEGTNGRFEPNWEEDSNHKIIGPGTGGLITWNPNNAKQTETDAFISPTTVLNHEFDHAAFYDKHPMYFKVLALTEDEHYGTKEEARVITGSEQKTAKALKEIKADQVTRRSHEFKEQILVSDPRSTQGSVISPYYNLKPIEINASPAKKDTNSNN